MELFILPLLLFSQFCIPLHQPILQFERLFCHEVLVGLSSPVSLLFTCCHVLPADALIRLAHFSQDSVSLGKCGPSIGWFTSSRANAASHVSSTLPPLHCHPFSFNTSTAHIKLGSRIHWVNGFNLVSLLSPGNAIWQQLFLIPLTFTCSYLPHLRFTALPAELQRTNRQEHEINS